MENALNSYHDLCEDEAHADSWHQAWLQKSRWFRAALQESLHHEMSWLEASAALTARKEEAIPLLQETLNRVTGLTVKEESSEVGGQKPAEDEAARQATYKVAMGAFEKLHQDVEQISKVQEERKTKKAKLSEHLSSGIFEGLVTDSGTIAEARSAFDSFDIDVDMEGSSSHHLVGSGVGAAGSADKAADEDWKDAVGTKEPGWKAPTIPLSKATGRSPEQVD